MKTFKTNKGITLVALIITIIILLILTVVAISSITDQGLFTKSQEAVNSYEDSREAEEGKLTAYGSEIDKYLGKDKKYILPGQDFFIKINKNNKLDFDTQGTLDFEYVTVTPEILAIVNGYGYPIPDSVKDSSRALHVETGEEGGAYILLSKDEKILYYAGYEFILEGTDMASNAKVYSYLEGDVESHIIEVSENIGFVIHKEGDYILKIGSIEPCTDITSCNNCGSVSVINNMGPYTKVLLDASDLPASVYSETLDGWTGLSRYSESNKLTKIVISEIQYTRNQNMKKEEIQKYIEMPFSN